MGASAEATARLSITYTRYSTRAGQAQSLMLIAAIYARKSTEQTGADADAKSVARQIESARAFAAAGARMVSYSPGSLFASTLK